MNTSSFQATHGNRGLYEYLSQRELIYVFMGFRIHFLFVWIYLHRDAARCVSTIGFVGTTHKEWEGQRGFSPQTLHDIGLMFTKGQKVLKFTT